jgi:hypothetical protein
MQSITHLIFQIKLHAAFVGVGILLIGSLASGEGSPAPSVYNVTFSTYFGGNSFDACRDVCIDHDGNIVVVGGTSSTNFPATGGTFSQAIQPAGSTVGKLGACDAYVAKFSPKGQLIWATYVGGPNYDRAYAVEVDSQNQIFVSGRAGEGFPTTSGCYQPMFKNTDSTTANGNPLSTEYGLQNGFLARLSSSGQLDWATYVFYGQLCRDLALDAAGNVIVTSGWNGNGTVPPAFVSGYKQTPTLPGGGNTGSAFGDSCIIKLSSDGTQVLWATWLCGNRADTLESMLRVGANGDVYFANLTKSSNMPFNAADNGRHSLWGASTSYDYYLARVSADGQSLVYGTYLGGTGNENLDTHQLAIDDQGNAYVAMLTPSTDVSTTSGVFQPAPGGAADVAVVKVGLDGAVLACTYLGGSDNEIVEGLSLDANGNVYITGATKSPNFPVAGTPFEATYGPDAPFNATYTAAWNGFLTVMAPDLKNLSYSTFMGKQCIVVGQNAVGGFHSNTVAPDGSVIAVGSWVTANFPTTSSAHQTTFVGGATPSTSGATYTKYSDAVMARFAPPELLYAGWATSKGLTGSDALDTASPSGDGIPNLTKYALDLDPHQFGSMPTNGVSPGLPALVMEPGALTLRFLKHTGKTDLTYAVETSSDLATWNTSEATTSILSSSGSVLTMKATVPTGSDTKKFARLKVTRTP